jgi:hypothetical protein
MATADESPALQPVNSAPVEQGLPGTAGSSSEQLDQPEGQPTAEADSADASAEAAPAPPALSVPAESTADAAGSAIPSTDAEVVAAESDAAPAADESSAAHPSGGAAGPEEEVAQTSTADEMDAGGDGGATPALEQQEGQSDAADDSAAAHVSEAEDASAASSVHYDAASEHELVLASATTLPAPPQHGAEDTARGSPAQMPTLEGQSTARAVDAAADASARGSPALPSSGTSSAASTAGVQSFPINIDEEPAPDSDAAPAANEGFLSTEALQWAAAAVVVAACAPCVPLAIGGLAIRGVVRCFRRR